MNFKSSKSTTFNKPVVRSFFTCCWQLKKKAVVQLSPNVSAHKEITPCSDLSDSVVTPLIRDTLLSSGTNTISSTCMRNIKRTKGLAVSKQVLGVQVLPDGVGALQEELGTMGSGEKQLPGHCQVLPQRGDISALPPCYRGKLGLKVGGGGGGEAGPLSTPLGLSLAPGGIDDIGSGCEI